MARSHFDTSQLLWRTRGAEWDFDFVLRPQVPALWLDVFSWVFPENQAPVKGVEYRKGSLIHEASGHRAAYPFYAAAFSDAEHTDTAGRQVQQFFIYVVKQKSGSIDLLEESDWAHDLLSALSIPYSAIFDMHRGADETARDYTKRLTQAFHDKLPPEVSVAARTAGTTPHFIDMGNLDLPEDDPEREKKASRPAESPSTAPREQWGMIVVGAGLLIAILLGLTVCRQTRAAPRVELHENPATR